MLISMYKLGFKFSVINHLSPETSAVQQMQCSSRYTVHYTVDLLVISYVVNHI